MRTVNIGRFMLAALAAVLLAAPSPAREVVLVENGVSLAPIVVLEDAPPFTRQAADELAEYIEKISGARPEVIEGRPDPVPEPAIWVGHQPVLDELFPNLDFGFQHPEEILVAANGNHLVIAGRDVWDPDRLVLEGSRRTVVGVQEEYGTVNAVYTFLQDFLDVRWLWPGELGIDVVRRDTIAFEPFEYRYHPQIRSRSGVFNFSKVDNTQGTSHEWVRFQRLQLDSLQVPGGHGFSAWWDKFHETHPDYFALQPDGTRGGGEEPFPSARTVKMCKSNPAVWEQWIKTNVEEALERNPAQKVFNAAAGDGYHSGYCICENCRAWDHPQGEPYRLMWQGLAQVYVSLGDRQVTFANHLGRLLKERFPGRDYYVSILSYGPSRAAPVEARPADNVIIGNVANFVIRPGYRDRDSLRDDPPSHREQYQEWARMGAQQFWRPNTGNPAGWRQGLPDVPIRHVMDSVQFAAEHGAVGVFVDMVWEHWPAHAPLYYTMGKLLWNPGQDGEALLEEFYQRGFGAAAEEVKAYWTLMEDNRNAYFEGARTHADYSVPASRWREIYTDEVLDQAEARLGAAAARVADGPEIHRERVALAQWGLEYTRLMLDIVDLMQRYRESDQQDEMAANQVRTIWDRILSMRDRFPSIKRWGWMDNPERRPHWRGWHPDNM